MLAGQAPWTAGCVAIMFNFNPTTGRFASVVWYNVAPGYTPHPRFLRVADLNRDGKQDVISTCWGSNQLSVLIQAGGGNGPMGPPAPDDPTWTWNDTEGPFWPLLP